MSQTTQSLTTAIEIIKNAKNKIILSTITTAPEPDAPDPPKDERADRRDDRNIESDRRWRREEGGDRGGGHFSNDWAGRSILSRYLTGGDDWVIINDPEWTNYMQSNEILTNDLKDRALNTAISVFDNHQNACILINESYDMEIENGEGVVGYQYLHGTNADVGGFERQGNASIEQNSDGTYTVTMDMSYTWNDTIDPNPQYGTDTFKSTIAEIVTFGQADPYNIHIIWNETTVVDLDADGNIIGIRNDE